MYEKEREQERQYDARKNATLNMGALPEGPSVNGLAGDYYSGTATGSPLRRTPIHERIAIALHEGDRAIRKAEAAHRAKRILEDHPEFATLLDALDEF